MSQKESIFLPDGRRTSDLKVTELKKELDKLGKSKSGNKSELLNRLNESFHSTQSSLDESCSQPIDTSLIRDEHRPVGPETNCCDGDVGGDSGLGLGEALVVEEDERVVSIARESAVLERCPVDIDSIAAAPLDDNQIEPTEINQSVDALDLFVPIDDSLNPVPIDDNSTAAISNTANNNDNDTSICDKSITEDLRTVTVLNESQDQQEMISEKPNNNEEVIDDLEETHIDMYDETDQIDLMELDEEAKQIESKPKRKDRERERDKEKDRERGKEKHKEREKDRERKRKREKHDKSDPPSFVNSTTSTETAPAIVTESPEDGEVIPVPITARLGKRKTENSENNSTNTGSIPTTVIVEEQSSKMGNDVNNSGGGQLSSENIEKSIDGSSHNSKRTNKRTSAGQSGGLKETKASGYTIDNVERIQPPQRPRHSQTECVRVDNLVRPFTQGQLTDMLSKHGRVTDIWLNKIKSIAYVRYESIEAAERAREGLDGCKWPSINPKLLCCDFVSQREMDWMKEKGDTASGAPPAVSNTVPVVSNSNSSSTSVAHNNSSNTNQSATRERKRPRDNAHNEGTLLPPAVPPTHSDNNKRVRRGPSPSGDHHRHSRHKPIDNNSNNPGVNSSSAKSVGTDNLSHSQASQQSQSHHHRQSRHNVNNTSSTHNTNTNTSTHREKSRDRSMRHTGGPGNHQHHYHQQQQHKSASPVGNPPAAPAPSAAKMLEDIFRKTVTQPAIYWLPVIKDKKEETVAAAPAKKTL